MTSRLTASLREAPATVPALAAVALFAVWATSQAAYPVTDWAPGALIVLALLCIALVVLHAGLAQMPMTVRVGLAALAAYTALSYLSILWAGVPGDAWEGANRTLLYLLVFALFACWPQRGPTAALLLVCWTLALVAVAAFVALHVYAAGASSLPSLMPGGRLDYPSGYPNANAAQWLMAFWPALLLARSERLAWALRGLLAGGAVLLAGVALLSQSRGSLYATPVMVVLVFALVPGRVRTFALLVPVTLGLGACTPALLAAGDRLQGENAVPAHVHGAIQALAAAALAVGLAVALGAAIETRAALSEQLRQRVGRGLKIAALATLVLCVLAGVAVAGNPVTRLESAWHSFKSGYGSESSGSRLASGLGSNRYDFYRVALDEFREHPLLGIGADNFQQQYLVHGRSQETPHYPHSVELRTLVQGGLIGALLALVGLAAALWGAARALRAPDPLARSAAAAAMAGFAYWLVHGSFDWFWEFAGLGAPAFALLGLACALAPRALRVGDRWPKPARVAGAVVALLAAASLTAPWLSQLQIEDAARIWTRAPFRAYSRLADAASLNPLSDEADLVAGDIALRFNDLARADGDFARALRRSPDDAYATLERGAIASARGQRQIALSFLERAVRLEPRAQLAQATLRLVRQGAIVNVQALNRQILLEAHQLA
jgi:tetratricopeptide (TPR) repeat protein